uniref:Uncharacterized protein n=1 Tax=Arundo donax TaxID=35708 RepID=A0A0A9E0T1_ARUDO
MERGGQGPGRRRLLTAVGEHERRGDVLGRHLPEPDLAVARRGGRVDARAGAGGRRRHRHSEREVADQHPHERARVHGAPPLPRLHSHLTKPARNSL